MLTPEMKQLMFNADQSALVFGRADTDEEPLLVVFDELADEQYRAAAMQNVMARKLLFAGIFVMQDGQAQAKCASWESTPVMILASATYTRRIAEKIKAEQSPRGDSVSWLEQLIQLPDTRSEFGSA